MQKFAVVPADEGDFDGVIVEEMSAEPVYAAGRKLNGEHLHVLVGGAEGRETGEGG